MNDRGSIVIGWLGKLVVAFALLGVLAFDGFTLVTASFGAADDASTAANEAAQNYRTSRSPQLAYDAAVAAVADKPDTLPVSGFSIAPNGVVTVTVQRNPKTLWMHRIGPLKKWTHVDQTATASPGS